ncbi:MAG: BlaI/MecI/CopY family transcriptional regulator [Bryobacterales bacterium]
MKAEPVNGKYDRLPPALELEALKVLWADQEELTVAKVREAMKPNRRLAYTTVLTLLERLFRKGLVTRRKRGRGYSYRPALERDAALDIALDRLVNDFFGNSRQRLLSHLEQTVAASQDESSPRQLDSVLL